MNRSLKRRGIASIIGTLFFALTFLTAVGAFTYLQAEQMQYIEALQNAQALVSQHQRESLAFQSLSNGTLAVRNAGASSSQIVATVLKFVNGSVFSLSQSYSIGTSSVEGVQQLIPNGAMCGSSSCASRFTYLVGSTIQGDGIGLVTSLGNTFWLNSVPLPKGTYVLISDDETPGVVVGSPTETTSQSYSLAANTYSRIIAEGEVYIEVSSRYFDEAVTIRVYIGSSVQTYPLSFNNDIGGNNPEYQEVAVKFSAVQTAAAPVMITIVGGYQGQTAEAMSLRVYGVV